MRVFWTIVITVGVVAVAAISLALVLLLSSSGGERELSDLVEPEPIEHDQFTRSLAGLLAPSFTSDNRVDLLVNGKEIFPAMLAAIDDAKKTITFETFIYWQGDIAVEFADAFCRAAARNVDVNVLLDWVGSRPMDRSLLKRMRKAGVRVVLYHPPRWSTLGRTNHRTHRKILVVDGKVGFTGGVGIAQEWCGDGPKTGNIRDNHFRLAGPIVSQLQGAFMDNWLKSRQSVLHGEAYFPEISAGGQTGDDDQEDEPDAGHMRAMLFQSSPDQGSESLRLMFLFAIKSARESIRLSAAYFIPDDLMSQALIQASSRGVRVQIIVPDETIDKAVVRYVSREYWRPLLDAGIDIREYKGSMYHAKGIIIDDVFVSIGSGNFDNRSMHLNDEANLLVYDRQFARTMIDSFEDDLTNTEVQTIELWEKRPYWQRIYGRVARLIDSQL